MDSKSKLTNTNPNEVIVKVDVNGKSDEMDSQNDTNSDRSVKTIDVGVQNDGDSSSKASEERSVQWEGLLKKGVLGKQDLGSRECLEVWTEQERGHRKSFMEEESAKEKTRLILLKQCSAILKQGEERFTKESLHRAFQDEDLLERIFRLFDTDQKQYLVQEDWIEYLKGRLTEPKQLDFIEQVESVAYVLVGSGDVTLFTFNHILQNKVVTNKLFRVVDTDGDGYSSADEVMEFLSVVSSSRPRVGFNQQSVDQLEQLFRQTVGDEKEITREQFKKIVVSKNPFFTERVFQIFDEDDSGAISLQEFIAAVNKFAGQTPDDKIRFLFQVYDLDGDGLIQHRELQHVMRACMEENGMEFSDDQLLELTSAMFEDADPQRRGAITFEALRGLLCRHDGLLENLTISIDRWLVPPKQRPEPTSLRHRISKLKPYQLSLPYVRNNYVYLGYLAVFFLVNIGLFVSRAIEYRKHNGLVIIARACGQCLNFNCSWLLVLMLRQCITQLRVRGLNCVLPLDHHIYLHKLTGVLVAVYSVVHTLMHLCNFSIIVVNDPVVNANNYTLNEWLLTTRPGLFGLLPGCANPTGVALCLLLVVVCGCSQPAIRRGGCFEIFYWTHLLYVPFWVLLLFHGPNFWKWFVLPGTVYVFERILRIVWVRSGHGKSYISSGILLPSRVTHLEVKRPPHFEFRAGDYVFVNIPAIATYEWHPFTISSAPEQTGHIWLHIRGVGEWTNHLYEYFEEEHERLNSGDQAKGQSAKARRKSSINKRRGSGGTRRSADFSPAVCIDEEKPYDGQAITPIQDKTLLAKLRFEKSFSMPDVMRNQKKKQRMYALHEYKRAESETSLDQLAGSKPPPPRPALANNFRYLRRKPAIVTLTTPSLDERRRSNDSIITIARRRLSKSLSPDKDVELVSDNPDANATSPSDSPNDTMEDYPIGKPLEIYLDGPYGAASSHIFGAQHAALVAAGIGVTPFASILQALMRRHWAARAVCPRCDHAFHTANPTDGTTLKKVDFFWINREQRSFEWFVSLLSQLEMEQAELGGERFLEMHMYITSALQRTDMKAVGLQLALDLLHEKEKRDLITGLKTRTNAGRPNWDKVFKQLQEQNKGKVTVFYCGPPQLARVLRVKCDQFGFHFRKEVF